ncbi:unnamed protein product [Brassica napus]|uniref:Large ribosomal subunit protein bL21m n=1 Tax=Brassica napus TaxID=3708 RepID=A0A816WDZ6_BRANA|nr:unnamed protein product [Brassica napus]
MASLRCLRELSRRATTVLSINQTPLISSLPISEPCGTTITHATPRSLTRDLPWCNLSSRSQGRHFSSKANDTDESSEGEDDDEEDYEDSAEMEVEREYSPAEKVEAAAEIGYKVMGPLKPSERLFKPYEPVFAVVQIGSHQFKVSNGDSIFTEKLKFCDINDKLVLTKVLLLGSASQTIIGRPILPDATVHAVVEEHALDEKVLIFKKKRRKNYRRTTGHRQELTKLRITDIQGIEKPEPTIVHKPSKAADTEQPEAELVEHETKSLIEHNKPIRSPHNHKEKSVESIQFGSFYLATDNSSVNTNGPLKKGQADGAVKSRPSSSQSAGSQKGLDASTPSTSDKISDTEVNGIIKEVSERKPLTNGVTVKADPIGLGKLCVSDAESDSLYKASSSKFQALEDSEILLSDSSSNSVPRKNNQMVATETPLPVKKELTPRGLINAGNLCLRLGFTLMLSFCAAPPANTTPRYSKAVLRSFTPDVLNNMSGRPRQEDAQEFLSFIMDQMNDELLKLKEVSHKLTASKSSVVTSADDDDEWETVGPKNKSAVTRTQSFVPSELSDIFGGQLRSVVKAKGSKDSATVQPYLLLHLDIHPGAVRTIEDALHLFSAPEDLEGYRASVTGKAGVVSARKSIKIQKLSKIMILHLMRFSYGNQGSTKLHKPVHFPLGLNLGRYVLVSPSNGGLKYELVATITHHGRDPSKGHYTADARRKNNQWLRLDDASVTTIGTKQVLHDQAYVLFYKQV